MSTTLLLGTVVFLFSVITLAVCLTLVLHPQYRCGVLGTIGFGVLALAAGARATGILEHGFREISQLGMLIWVGLAFLMLHLLLKFLRRLRCARRDSTWYSDRWSNGKT